MERMKRLFSLLLALALVAGCLIPIYVHAEGTPVVSAEHVSAEPGTAVDVAIKLEGNPGICALAVKVQYSAYLTLTNVTDGDILGEDLHGGKLDANPYNLTWNNMKDYDSNGTIAVLTFLVADNAPDGAVLDVVLSIEEDVYNINEDIFVFSVESGSITVGCAHENKTSVPAKDAGCSFRGNHQYYVCDSCGAVFKSDGVTKTTVEEETIPALGHDWHDADCVTPKTCDRCGKTEGEPLGHDMAGGICTRCGFEETPVGPQIISQPEDFVGMVGDTAIFTVVAEGEGLKYQWYYYDTAVSDWKKAGNGTNATLRVEFKGYRNGQQYRCEITDSEGNTATTNAVRLLALEMDLVIVTQPVSATGAVNQEMSFTVEATGNGLVYQWYYSDDAGATWKLSGTPGFATNTLLPILRTYRDGYLYYCQITDVFGNTANSEVVSMTVKSSSVTIVTQPEDVNEGIYNKLYTYKVKATGENLEYRWEYSDDGGETWQLSWNEGYNTDTLNVRLYTNRNGYLYRCKVTSGLKVTEYTDAAVLNLQAPSVTIVSQPENVASVAGKTIKIHVEATGKDLTYQWYRSNDDGANWILTYLGGYTTDTLEFVANANRAALYMCKITDGSGKAIWTERVKLRVLSAELKILSQPVSVTCAAGETATFTVQAQGDTAKYQWYASSDGGATWSNTYLDGYNTASLSFTVNATRAAKVYKCVVTDVAGNKVESDIVSITIK